MAKECRPGDSISIHGVCLTVAAVAGETLDFDVIPETLERSVLGGKRPGDRLNIERSLRVGDRLDGHMVQGHVDGTATVTAVEQSSGEHVVWLRPSDQVRPFMIPKGSVAIDGVSMTIATLRGEEFSVALIPTTIERTTLGDLREGDAVNIESDILVRTILQRLDQLFGPEGAASALQNAGFA